MEDVDEEKNCETQHDMVKMLIRFKQTLLWNAIHIHFTCDFICEKVINFNYTYNCMKSQ